MDAQSERHARKRTAVLVVHGMGSQRPLDTARGIVEAVWLEGDLSARGERRMWTHPERSGVDDIDGGLFALTRWTNLYFPVSQLLWGDAIGGEVG